MTEARERVLGRLLARYDGDPKIKHYEPGTTYLTWEGPDDSVMEVVVDDDGTWAWNYDEMVRTTVWDGHGMLEEPEDLKRLDRMMDELGLVP